jgi:hypothetical protein
LVSEYVEESTAMSMEELRHLSQTSLDLVIDLGGA